MKIKISSVCNFGVFVILFLSFTRSFHNRVFGGNSSVIFLLLLAAVMVATSYALSHHKINKSLIRKETIFWILVLIVSLIRNQDIVQGNWLSYVQIFIGTLLIFFLPMNDRWCCGAIKCVKWITMFLLITGIFFLGFKGLLKSYIVPLFNLDNSSDYYSENLLSQINNGYMTGLTSHYSTMGIYMSIGFIFMLGHIFNNRDRLRFKDIFPVGYMFVGIFLTGKRSALLFPLMAGLTIYSCYFKPKNLRRRYNYIIYSIIAVLSAGIVMSIMPNNFSGTIERFIKIMGSTDLQTITNKRYEMLWLPAIYLFLESPLLGIGWGNFKYSFTKYYKYTANQNNVHNVYLQLLCETGVIGTAIILTAIIYTLYSTMKYLGFWRKGKLMLNNSQLAILGISASMQIYFMLYAISGNPLYDITCYFPYVIAVCMSMAVRNALNITYRERNIINEDRNINIS